MPPETLEALLPFFKALADETRLKVVGLLAREPYSGEALAALLKVKPATISHHLAKLAEAGLVSTQQDGHAKLYALRLSAVQNMAARLFNQETLPRVAAEVDTATYESRVLKNFLKRDGSLKEIPAQQKKLQIVLRHLLQDFAPEQDYAEAEVNAILGRYHPDTASLRRALISYRLMTRAHNIYRRNTMPAPETPTALNVNGFFNALAESLRLQIAGQLAQQPRTPAELATALDARPPAVRQQLDYLQHAGLVSPQPDGRYRWRLDHIHTLAAQVNTAPAPPTAAESAAGFERQVLLAFLNPDGSLRDLPAQDKKLQVLLHHIVATIAFDQRLTEKEINAHLARFHPDTASLRRYLVDYKLLAREKGVYWRVAS